MTADLPVDAAELESFLSAELGDPVVETEVLHDGLNLAVAVSTPSDDPAYVLRRPTKLRETDSFNDVAQEYGVLAGLHETQVPAPEPVLHCEDDSLLGAPFLVMTHLEGEPIPLGEDPPPRFQRPRGRERIATGVVDTLADLHTVDVEPFAAVCDEVPIGDQVDRNVGLLEDATGVTGHEPPRLWDVADWLQANVPADSATALVHGDFRPGNILFTGAEKPEIGGLLDWETAFLGDPLTELGYLLLRWREDGDPTPSLDGIEERYDDEAVIGELEKVNEQGLAPFSDRAGSPSRGDLIARYEDRTGLAFENGRFYRAFAAFTLATVWAALLAHQVETGGETEREPWIEYVALVAVAILEEEGAL